MWTGTQVLMIYIWKTLYNQVTCCYFKMGWKLIISFHLLPRAGSLGSSQVSQKCRLSHSVKISWTGAFFEFRIFLRNATIGFCGEGRWIFMLRRSLIGFRPICVLDEYLYLYLYLYVHVHLYLYLYLYLYLDAAGAEHLGYDPLWPRRWDSSARQNCHAMPMPCGGRLPASCLSLQPPTSGMGIGLAFCASRGVQGRAGLKHSAFFHFFLMNSDTCQLS
jgi:hypothetical protein